MLKLLVYAKIDYVESVRIIVDIAVYHEIYKFVSDEVKPSDNQYKGIEESMDVISKYYSK